MKYLIALAAFALATSAATFTWTDANEPGLVKRWNIYATTNIVGSQSTEQARTNSLTYTNWTLWATVPTNAVTTMNGTNTWTTNIVVTPLFFAIKSANDWTESPFSPVDSTFSLLTNSPAIFHISR